MTLSGRYVNTPLKRPQWRLTANYSLHQRLQVGFEVNPKAEEVGPLVTLFLSTETEMRPALFFGTSSDRIGSPSGEQSYFATLSKYITKLRTSFYGSLNYSKWDEQLNFPFGLGVELSKDISVRPMYDGDRGHVMLNWYSTQYGVSLMYVWLETMGVAFFVGF